jgi:hypothetical protein
MRLLAEAGRPWLLWGLDRGLPASASTCESTMLLFKKKFLPAIRAGEKTQTIRLWKHRMMRDGQRSYIPGAGYITIDRVQEVNINELTDADAIPDGFPTAVALRQELDTLYADKIAAGHKAFRVVFHLQEENATK